jgi:XrtJ-associated TM-motif-TM protein
MKFKTVLIAALFMLLAVVRLHAQDIDGCTDSPENPTLVLGLIVSAAGVGYTQVRRYLQGRNNSKSK